jgi:hypothetical protein
MYLIAGTSVAISLVPVTVLSACVPSSVVDRDLEDDAGVESRMPAHGSASSFNR